MFKGIAPPSQFPASGAPPRLNITLAFSGVPNKGDKIKVGPKEQGYAAAKSLAALAGKVRLAVAGKFPIIPKGYSGLVEQLLAG